MRSEAGNHDRYPPLHITQSTSQHGDTAPGVTQIYSEVTFSADTPLSLWTKIRILYVRLGVTDVQNYRETRVAIWYVRLG